MFMTVEAKKLIIKNNQKFILSCQKCYDPTSESQLQPNLQNKSEYLKIN
jgi:hypothetical protein